jgi:hypothetical protein
VATTRAAFGSDASRLNSSELDIGRVKIWIVIGSIMVAALAAAGAMTTAEGQNAVIGLAFDPDERPSEPDRLVNIVGSVLALVLDRQHARVRRDARPAS